MHKSRKTDAAYTIALKLFVVACPKKYLEEITRKDMLGYIAHLKEQGNAPRTVANRVANVKCFFNMFGAEWPLRREDKPKYTEKAVAAYAGAEIRQLLAAADTEESELLQFFLFTGGREQEIQYATWADIDFESKTFTVREKLDLRFTPKDKEEGEIPIPDTLIDLLRNRRRLHADERLIFSNTQGNPDGHLLRILKRGLPTLYASKVVMEMAQLCKAWKTMELFPTLRTAAWKTLMKLASPTFPRPRRRD